MSVSEVEITESKDREWRTMIKNVGTSPRREGRSKKGGRKVWREREGEREVGKEG